MDEEIAIINSNTRTEKIKNFFINNKKNLLIVFFTLLLIIFSYFSYEEFKKRNKIKTANIYNTAVTNFISNEKSQVKSRLLEIIDKKDKTYSPLAFYFLVDNNIIKEKKEVNELFDKIIEEVNLDYEIKNLLIYKKALFNSDFETENILIEILQPLINSKSIWKSHALFLLAEYFYNKDEKIKSKEFFVKILELENSNQNIKIEAQKKINRDLSD